MERLANLDYEDPSACGEYNNINAYMGRIMGYHRVDEGEAVKS